MGHIWAIYESICSSSPGILIYCGILLYCGIVTRAARPALQSRCGNVSTNNAPGRPSRGRLGCSTAGRALQTPARLRLATGQLIYLPG